MIIIGSYQRLLRIVINRNILAEVGPKNNSNILILP